MAETTDGSSRAAQGAPSQPRQTNTAPSAFFGRFFRRRDRIEDPPQEFGNSADIAAARDGARAIAVNVRRIRDIRIEDVSVPRADITAVPDSITLTELVAVFKETALTRLPVFSETLDNPLGLVHLKDVALRHGFGQGNGDFDVREMLRPLLYCPPSMSMGVLLQKMQSARMHMALVIDEYGGVDGLVTIEDLVEQIIGEIEDEHDADEDDLWQAEGPGVFLAFSRAPLDEFEKAVGTQLFPPDREEEIDTLGGLVFMLAGRVPERGEVICHPDGHELEVVDADPRRVKRIRLRLNSGASVTQAAE